MVNAVVSSVLQSFVYSTLSLNVLKSLTAEQAQKQNYILTPTLNLILLHSYMYVPVFMTILFLGAQARDFGVILDSFLSVILYLLHLQILSDVHSKYICIIFHMNCFNSFLTDLDSVFALLQSTLH